MNTFYPHGFCKRYILVIQADLGDIAGLFPEHRNEARVPIKRVELYSFCWWRVSPSICKKCNIVKGSKVKCNKTRCACKSWNCHCEYYAGVATPKAFWPQPRQGGQKSQAPAFPRGTLCCVSPLSTFGRVSMSSVSVEGYAQGAT